MNQRIRVLQELGEQFERAVVAAEAGHRRGRLARTGAFHVYARPIAAGVATLAVVVGLIAALHGGSGDHAHLHQPRTPIAIGRPGRGANPVVARGLTGAGHPAHTGTSADCVNSTTGTTTPCTPPPRSLAPHGLPAPLQSHPGSPTRLVAQLNMSGSTGAPRPTALARIVAAGRHYGITIVGVGLPPNTKGNAYAVWLSNGPGGSKLLGFVNPAVRGNGKLRTVGVLPTGAFRYHKLLLTLETKAKPTAPQDVVLGGPFHR